MKGLGNVRPGHDMTHCPLVTNSTVPHTWIEATFRVADSTCALFTVVSAVFLLYATSLGFLHPPSLSVANRFIFWVVTVIEAIIISNVQAGFIRIIICLVSHCDLHSTDPTSTAGIASITFLVLWPLIFVVLMLLQACGFQSMTLFVDVDCKNGMWAHLLKRKSSKTQTVPSATETVSLTKGDQQTVTSK